MVRSRWRKKGGVRREVHCLTILNTVCTLTVIQMSSGVQGTMPLSASPSFPWCAPKMPASTAHPTTTTSSGGMEVSTSLLWNSSLSICWSRGILQLPPASTTWGIFDGVWKLKWQSPSHQCSTTELGTLDNHPPTQWTVHSYEVQSCSLIPRPLPPPVFGMWL